MKMKSFAMLAMSGFLTASIAYVAPVMADDSSEGAAATESLQAPTDALPSSQSSASSADNNVGSTTGDEGGPDTATGDDDY